ncbi:hypothetical protein HDU97_005103, partial [Phlyctochytrium planicorne]
VHRQLTQYQDYGCGPQLATNILRDFQLRHSFICSTKNRAAKKYKSHFDVLLLNNLHTLCLKLKANLPDYLRTWVNVECYSAKGVSRTGISHPPDSTTDGLSIQKMDNWSRTEKDLLQADPVVGKLITSMVFIAQEQGTKYAVVPVHTDDEKKLFKDLKRDIYNRTRQTVNFNSMAAEWNEHVETNPGLNRAEANRKLFYKLPDHLRVFDNHLAKNRVVTSKINAGHARLGLKQRQEHGSDTAPPSKVSNALSLNPIRHMREPENRIVSIFGDNDDENPFCPDLDDSNDQEIARPNQEEEEDEEIPLIRKPRHTNLLTNVPLCDHLPQVSSFEILTLPDNAEITASESVAMDIDQLMVMMDGRNANDNVMANFGAVEPASFLQTLVLPPSTFSAPPVMLPPLFIPPSARILTSSSATHLSSVLQPIAAAPQVTTSNSKFVITQEFDGKGVGVLKKAKHYRTSTTLCSSEGRQNLIRSIKATLSRIDEVATFRHRPTARLSGKSGAESASLKQKTGGKFIAAGPLQAFSRELELLRSEQHQRALDQDRRLETLDRKLSSQATEVTRQLENVQSWCAQRIDDKISAVQVVIRDEFQEMKMWMQSFQPVRKVDKGEEVFGEDLTRDISSIHQVGRGHREVTVRSLWPHWDMKNCK